MVGNGAAGGWEGPSILKLKQKHYGGKPEELELLSSFLCGVKSGAGNPAWNTHQEHQRKPEIGRNYRAFCKTLELSGGGRAAELCLLQLPSLFRMK